MAENNIRVRADLNPDAIDNADQDIQDPPPQDDHDGVVPVPPAAPGVAQTMLAFKVEQSKIPEYFGQKARIISQRLYSSGRLRTWPAQITGTTQRRTQMLPTISRASLETGFSQQQKCWTGPQPS
jgi:hypothetical protein